MDKLTVVVGSGRWWRNIAGGFLGTMLGTSAYMVYHNKLGQLPINVSFFWFSLFATIAAFFFPARLARQEKNHGRLGFDLWVESLRVGRIWIFLAAITQVLYFYCLLTSLQVAQSGVIMTVLVLQMLNPLFFVLAGYKWLGHYCQRWSYYVLGFILTTGGVFLYKYSPLGIDRFRLFDEITVLMLFVMIFDIANSITRAKHNQQHGVDALQTARSIQVIMTVCGLAWMLLGPLRLPTGEEFLALLFIGFVPTAYGSILKNRAQDSLGIPLSSSIANLRPFAALLLGAIPGTWLSNEAGLFTGRHWLGMVMALAGLLVVAWLAKPQPPGNRT